MDFFFFSESTKGDQSLILISLCLSFPSCPEGATNDEIFDDRLCELTVCGCMNKHVCEDKLYSRKFAGVMNTKSYIQRYTAIRYITRMQITDDFCFES